MTYLQNRSILDKELTQMRENILRLASLVDTAIEKEALRTLATQQPAAIDLRTTIVGMHLATELERIGDHATNVAEMVHFAATGTYPPDHDD